ncbi:restriction endonuclease [Vibrio vulnificus]|nr:restriction endonuclease [Vibrio vulnificus]
MKQQNYDWYQFQEEICDHFLSLGAEAETNVTVVGVRTNHDVDVLVKTKFLGEDITWVIEAKCWKKRVSKNHVLALRTIVDDLGADRGFIVSKVGFQKGAMEAAENTNVKLKTFNELKSETKDMVEAEILKMYSKRLHLIEDRYWSHSKKVRIKYGLRQDLFDFSFKFVGQLLLLAARKAIMEAQKMNYPIDLETHLKEQQGTSVAHNFQQLQNWLNLNLNHFEEKLIDAEWAMYQNGDYEPNLRRTADDEVTASIIMAGGGAGMRMPKKDG